MAEDLQSPAASAPSKSPGARRIFWLIGILVLFFILGLILVHPMFEPRRSLARMELADGRTLQIEGVTYGTKHRIGHRSIVVDRLGPWIPRKLRHWLTPKYPENTIELARPALVVWVNAIDPATGTNVDCQAIRTEFVDTHDDSYGADTSYWFGGQEFWRVGSRSNMQSD